MAQSGGAGGFAFPHPKPEGNGGHEKDGEKEFGFHGGGALLGGRRQESSLTAWDRMPQLRFFTGDDFLVGIDLLRVVALRVRENVFVEVFVEGLLLVFGQAGPDGDV